MRHTKSYSVDLLVFFLLLNDDFSIAEVISMYILGSIQCKGADQLI